MVKIAKEIGRTPAQVALNWLSQQGYNMFPIIGATKLSQIQDNLQYSEFVLAKEHLQQLNEASSIELGFPHDFFKEEIVQDFAFSGTLKTIEPPMGHDHYELKQLTAARH